MEVFHLRLCQRMKCFDLRCYFGLQCKQILQDSQNMHCVVSVYLCSFRCVWGREPRDSSLRFFYLPSFFIKHSWWHFASQADRLLTREAISIGLTLLPCLSTNVPYTGKSAAVSSGAVFDTNRFDTVQATEIVDQQAKAPMSAGTDWLLCFCMDDTLLTRCYSEYASIFSLIISTFTASSLVYVLPVSTSLHLSCVAPLLQCKVVTAQLMVLILTDGESGSGDTSLETVVQWPGVLTRLQQAEWLAKVTGYALPPTLRTTLDLQVSIAVLC